MGVTLWNCPNESRVFRADGYLQLDHSIIRQATIPEDKAVAQGVLRFDNHFQELHAEMEDIEPSGYLRLRE
jgi:anti-sigma-K factor RskA